VVCSAKPVPLLGHTSLSARKGSRPAGTLRRLRPGDSVRLTASLGWREVTDAIGGMPALIKNGRDVLKPCHGWFCSWNPRTAIGAGRRAGWSSGMRLTDLVDLFHRLRAVDAINLDGGGSSTMVVRGHVVNRPSDDDERPITSAVLVIRRPDPGERGLPS